MAVRGRKWATTRHPPLEDTVTDGDTTVDGSTAAGELTEDHEFSLLDPERHGPRGGSIRRWFLVSGDRRLVTLVLLVTVFAVLVAAGNLWPLKVRDLLENTNNVQMLFNTLLSGVILLVSIVVSITSVVLSQELGSLGTHQERVRQSMEFRESIEEVAVDDVSPSEADRFLGFVLETIYERTKDLEAAIEDHPNDVVRKQVEQLVDATIGDLHAVDDRLSIHNLERPNVLLAGLEYDYANQLFAVRYIRTYHGDELDEEQRDRLDAFAAALDTFEASREYFKSLFFKREMADLSSNLLYVSLPVILYISYVLLALGPQVFPETALFGLPLLTLYVSVAYTIALAPYLVLTAYVIRSAFVARRSLEVGPFNVHPDVSKPDFDLDD